MSFTLCEQAGARQKLSGSSISFFTGFISFLADSPVQIDSGDFCVMSRRAVRLLLNLPEKLRFVRGLRAWVGLPSKAISHFAAGSRSWRSAIFIVETDETGFLGPHILFDKTIESGTSCAAVFFASVQ